MLWYGYIYYIIFNIILFIMLIFFLRLFFINSLSRLNSYLILNRLFLASISFLFFFTFIVLNYLLDYYQDLILLSHSNTNSNITILNTFFFDKTISILSTSLNLTQVYYYPFIYVFLIVTVLSIIYCLSYNYDELVSFMFYCQIILTAGYVLFFTDSLILFFLSYEMLLVPSFFILYKFAKTRRCVEAAYLMFFWTQFGALFLIFAFIYLFIICDSSKFTIISMNYFTSFEVNFIFLCCIIGFGVKLPI